MEFHSDVVKGQGVRRTAKIHDGGSSFRDKEERKKFGSILKFEKHERSYDEVHPKILKNVDNSSPKSKGFQHKQQFERKFHKQDELVMHMSNLPSYLERGGKPQEKAFNIGVLDWRLLENWQHSHIGNNHLYGRHLASSSSHSSSKESSSHPQWRIAQPSFPSHSNASPTKGKLQDGETSKSKDSWQRRVPEPVHPVSGLKGRDRFLHEEASMAQEKLSAPRYAANLDCSEGRKIGQAAGGYNPTFLEDLTQTSKTNHCRSAGANQCNISGGSNANIFQTRSLSSNGPVNEFGSVRDSQLDQSSFKFVKSENCPSSIKEKMPFPRSNSNSPSRLKNLENRRSDVDSGIKMSISESTNVRNSSPTRRFSLGSSRNGKSSSSSVTSSMPYPAREKISDSKINQSSACSRDTAGEKSNSTNKSRSSPLRRLLDPLLKSKGGDRCHERNHSVNDKNLKSSCRRREAPASRSLKARLDLKGCRADDFDVPQPTEKNGPLRMQALLQVAVKNGLPLFTFTVDNCNDILAATVKEVSPRKTLHRWVYTFFSFSEMKKKNMHWINIGSKDGFIPNVIAQMKVSDGSYVDLDRRRSPNESCMREFVLSSAVSKDADQILGSMQNEELAAIVVKFPNQQLSQVESCLNSRDGIESGSGFDNLFDGTIILPGGHHGVPSRGLGEPSPLIERWKSGGSCDCGGWDLGCRLRILASNERSKSRSTVKFFSQEEVQENKPMFILSPFEDGIFSVEFNASITLIQAFSIGIAVLSSRKAVVALPPNMFGGKLSEDISLSENTLAKFSERPAIELSAKYVSYPPLSPVGRV